MMIQIILTSEQIQKRVKELAQWIATDYQNKNLIIIQILNGSFIFTADLVRYLSEYKLNLFIEAIKAKSYQNNASTGIVRIEGSLDLNIQNRNILIVDTILDTGLTIKEIWKRITAHYEFDSLEFCCLLKKKHHRCILDDEWKNMIKVKYVGFTIPDRFIVGYGLDFNNRFREHPYIQIL